MSVMPITTPTALVEEFKRSGEFDRLRREVLARFQQDESYPAFKESIESLARTRLTDDLMLSTETDTVLKELTQEIQRYPIVERAVSSVQTFSDPTFLSNLQRSMEKILHDDKNGRSASSSKGIRPEVTRVESALNAANQTQKVIPQAPQDNDAQGPLAPPVASGSTGVSPTQNSAKPISVTDAAQNPSPQQNSGGPDTTLSPQNSQAPAAMDTHSGPPLTSVASIENVKASTSIDDQRNQATTVDVEMEDGTRSSAP
ncbi:hypothetical protein CPC08DRAFT_718246 [Agrocybe pediades]|nr:hypothetical protein CPC08DRAFT_718246 [Agrocybe pediades]